MERHRRGKSILRYSDGTSDEEWVVDVKVVTFGVIEGDVGSTDERTTLVREAGGAADPLPKTTSLLVLRVTPPKADDV